MKKKLVANKTSRPTDARLMSQHKKIVKEFFATLGTPSEALKFFAPGARQHNPFVKGGMDALMESIASVQQSTTPQFDDMDFAIKHVFADGNMVAVHTELLNSKSRPDEGGLRQVHLFRFGPRNKIVEYWDITQQVTKDHPNPANAF
jgi:predicted SnoaL-like aldol condensation-catalyzing enzyme